MSLCQMIRGGEEDVVGVRFFVAGLDDVVDFVVIVDDFGVESSKRSFFFTFMRPVFHSRSHFGAMIIPTVLASRGSFAEAVGGAPASLGISTFFCQLDFFHRSLLLEVPELFLGRLESLGDFR